MKIIQCIDEIKILESLLQIEKSKINIKKRSLKNEIENIIQSIINEHSNITDPLELNKFLEDKFNIELHLLKDFYKSQEEEIARKNKEDAEDKQRKEKEQKDKEILNYAESIVAFYKNKQNSKFQSIHSKYYTDPEIDEYALELTLKFIKHTQQKAYLQLNVMSAHMRSRLLLMNDLSYSCPNANICTDSQITLIKENLIKELNTGNLIHKELNKKNNEKDKFIKIEEKYNEITLSNDGIKLNYLPEIIYKNGLLPYVNGKKVVSYKDIEYFKLMISCFISGSKEEYVEENIEDSKYLLKITDFFHQYSIETIKNNKCFFQLFFSSFSILNIKETINKIEFEQNEEEKIFQNKIKTTITNGNIPTIHTAMMNAQMLRNKKNLSKETFSLLKNFCTESEIKLKVSRF